MQQLLFAAQDAGMTGGDYAFFTYLNLASSSTLSPWMSYNMSDEEVGRRMHAFGVLKLVRLVSLYTRYSIHHARS